MGYNLRLLISCPDNRGLMAPARYMQILSPHAVTEELDAGPIMHQDVTHRDTVEDLVRLGSEVERRVLTRAVRWHLEDRILVDGGRTVVLE